jgi:Sec-independent protein secretion pathway component TatC
MYTGILDLVYIYIKIILVFSLFFIFTLLLYILLNFIKKGLYLFELIKVKLYFNFNLFLFYFIVFLLYIKVIPLVSLLFIAEQDNKYNFFSLNLEILIIKYLDYLLFLLFILIGFYILILIIFFLLQKNRYICFNRFFLSLFLIG